MDHFFDDYGSSESEKQPDDSYLSFDDDFYSDYPAPIKPEELPVNQIAAHLREENSPDLEFQAESDHQNSLEELLDELNNLIGLANVKTEVNRLVQYVRITKMRQSMGLSKFNTSLHAVFYGSPGTGKTTVARIYGKMLAAMGLLSKGHLVETDRSGLIASYVGQTENKTDEKIREAIGGVLFIDEAYMLSKSNEARWDYGEEAIGILLKRMEDYRDDLAVIAAGYPEPMTRFLNSNEGLKSRFSTFIKFNDYSPRELLEIFKLFSNQENYLLNDEVLELVLASIQNEYAQKDKYFGNARYVRNLFDEVVKNQALRIGTTILNPTKTDLRVLLPEDIPFIISNVSVNNYLERKDE